VLSLGKIYFETANERSVV